MGIYRRNVTARRVCVASADMSFRSFFCRRSTGLAPGSWNDRAHFHPYLPEYGDDDRAITDHWRTVAIDQLQRLVCADDNFWTRACEQRLDPPARSRLRKLVAGGVS